MALSAGEHEPLALGARDVLRGSSQSWLRRAQVKVGGVEERLRFQQEAPDFPEALLPFHSHPAYRALPALERARILTCGWVAYNAKTVVVETEIVTPVCTGLLRGDLPGVDDPWARRAVAEALVDEAYHTYLAVAVTNLSKEARGLEPPLAEFELARNVRAFDNRAGSKRTAALSRLAVATVSELLISNYLLSLSRDQSIQPIHRESVASHLQDELSHGSIFAELAQRVCRHLDAHELDAFSRQLALSAVWFSHNEWRVWSSILDYLRVPARRDLVAYAREAAAAGCVNPGNYAKLTEFAKRSGLAERPTTREAFESVGIWRSEAT